MGSQKKDTWRKLHIMITIALHWFPQKAFTVEWVYKKGPIEWVPKNRPIERVIKKGSHWMGSQQRDQLNHWFPKTAQLNGFWNDGRWTTTVRCAQLRSWRQENSWAQQRQPFCLHWELSFLLIHIVALVFLTADVKTQPWKPSTLPWIKWPQKEFFANYVVSFSVQCAVQYCHNVSLDAADAGAPNVDLPPTFWCSVCSQYCHW